MAATAAATKQPNRDRSTKFRFKFKFGSVENKFEKRIVEILENQIWIDNSKISDQIFLELQKHKINVRRNFKIEIVIGGNEKSPNPQGVINLLATSSNGNEFVAIEVDRRSPREKSIRNLQNLNLKNCSRIIAIRPNKIRNSIAQRSKSRIEYLEYRNKFWESFAVIKLVELSTTPP